MIDYRYIEAFLAVVNTSSISKAAEHLYVSQSSISKWIYLLEEEVGAQLIVRHKGYRTVELTTSGKELIPMAEEWVSLQRRITKMGENVFPSIRIASIDSLNTTRLPSVYLQLLRTYPNLEMTITSDYSNRIYHMVEKKQCDIGVTLMELYSPNLIVTPFLTESFQLLVYAKGSVDQTTPVRPQDLDIRKNLYLPSGLIYQQWHEYWWQSAPSFARVDTISTAEKLFQEEGMWMIVPQCEAEYFQKLPHIHLLPLDSPPPARTCYFVMHRYPRDSSRQVLLSARELIMNLQTQV